eukprot:CAMPEP_0175049624 /NCGR_PEP_ID=MMETSP0052_2-20121109/6826_1 /TAXON_ID=51329 ORGANISM="Polytomella parva, Strain SAG 63-3" /NCGR_SAMPLE_ID=MMETSP0052_2 /ASSEMBLY_ACC=CAM_ASM_000194 /LENGTH=1000 /DNA_ID=CAMNT_0016313775 /DNA_START=268 /DNA_END=3270 /DNA_ORIENTATION=+
MSTIKAITIGGVGAQPSLDDVVKVALKTPVALDAAGSERIKKESPAPKAFQPETLSEDAAAPPKLFEALEDVKSRAIVMARLLSIMSGKTTVRLQVVEFLANLLNKDIVPMLPLRANANPSTLTVLARACHGVGIGPDGEKFSSTLTEAGITAPGLSATEHRVLEEGASVLAGLSALTVEAGKKLHALSVALTALSSEVVGLQTKSFDQDFLEAQGYTHATAAGSEIRALLEGSKRINTSKADSAELTHFYGAPQTLGALGAALASAYSATRAEIQSTAVAPAKGIPAAAASPPELVATLDALARALAAAAAASLARTTLVLQTPLTTSDGAVVEPQEVLRGQVAACQTSLTTQVLPMVASAAASAVLGLTAGGGASSGLSTAMAADAALGVLERALSLEALAAVTVLRAAEGAGAVAVAAVSEEAAVAAAAAAEGKAKNKGKDRKAAAAAAAFALGKGTTILRQVVEKAAATNPSVGANGMLAVTSNQPLAATAAAVAVASLIPLVNPLSTAGDLGKLLSELRAVVEANQARRKPKIPKGTRDLTPPQMAIREQAFRIITSVFKRHGAVSIDTPVFELRETLMGKYGEDSKLIYDLADQGGEVLSLRYDLTVPFARYVAVHGTTNIRRFHIGKVYRRDQPQMNRGRFREFYQCDFDVAGAYSAMVPDAEVLKVLVEILSDLKLGPFEVKINHRKLLDAMLAIAGVPAAKFRPICSAIDKLDKEPWEAVRAEMVEEKGLAPEAADKIGEFVVLRGNPMALLETLEKEDHPLNAHPDARAALADLRLLFGFLSSMKALEPHFVFDLSLARGLDYYTGIIYEAALKGANVGSIAAGGRYDKLVGMFSGKDVPAVGVSIGIERVFAILEQQVKERMEAAAAAAAADANTAAAAAANEVRAADTDVLVASIGNGLQEKRMAICAELWAAGVAAEFGYKPNPKMADTFQAAFDQKIPFVVLFGEDELANGKVKIKDMDAKTEETVALDTLVAEMKKRIAARKETL